VTGPAFRRSRRGRGTRRTRKGGERCHEVMGRGRPEAAGEEAGVWVALTPEARAEVASARAAATGRGTS